VNSELELRGRGIENFFCKILRLKFGRCFQAWEDGPEGQFQQISERSRLNLQYGRQTTRFSLQGAKA
jgi:hypothetical protein